MTKARDFFRAFLLVRQLRQIMALNGIDLPEQKHISDATKGPLNYRFFFFAKIAFQLSL